MFTGHYTKDRIDHKIEVEIVLELSFLFLFKMMADTILDATREEKVSI